MKLKSKVVALAVTATMVVSVAPMTVSAASVKAPAKVTISSAKRTSDTKVKVTWKKLKKTPSGYAVYQKKGSSSWKLTKRVSKKTTSLSVAAKSTEQNQFKVRAYKTYKVKKYYNKKTKKYVSKKAYKKLAKKNRSIKKVTAYKYGKYSAIKTVKQSVAAMPTPEIRDDTEYCSFANGRYGANITVEAPAKVSGVTNLKYVVEKSEDGGKTYKQFTTVSVTDIADGDGQANFQDYDIDLSVDTYYRVYAQGTYNGKTVTGKAATEYVNKESFNSVNITYYEKTLDGKICADCKNDGWEASVYDVTELSDTELAEKHGTYYYCSVCGAGSHDKADVEDHIQEDESCSTGAVLSRDAKIENDSDFDREEEKTREMSWAEVDKSDGLFQKALNDSGCSDAEKVFVDKNATAGEGVIYIIYHGTEN